MWQTLEWFCLFLLFPVFWSGLSIVSCASKMSDNRVEGLETFTTRGPPPPTPVQQLDFTKNGTFVKCSKKHFQCGNGLCIHNSFVCDGEPDCDDKSDEDARICTVTENTCPDDKFRCNNGRCIPKHWQCDQEKDCTDGSDEDPEKCQTKICSAEEFSCRSMPGECIPLAWMCDQNKDCSDGSDETSCNERKDF